MSRKSIDAVFFADGDRLKPRSRTTLTSKLSRFAVLTTVAVGTGFAFFTGSAEPAMALCKKGTPHCAPADRYTPKVKVVPGSGWVADDCKYFPGLCNSSEVTGTARRR
jgi:hypothetical protein